MTQFTDNREQEHSGYRRNRYKRAVKSRRRNAIPRLSARYIMVILGCFVLSGLVLLVGCNDGEILLGETPQDRADTLQNEQFVDGVSGSTCPFRTMIRRELIVRFLRRLLTRSTQTDSGDPEYDSGTTVILAPFDSGLDGGFADGGFADGGFADGGFADGGFADGGFADGGRVNGFDGHTQ